jgi:hypothetical protein
MKKQVVEKNIVTVECLRFWSDWTTIEKVEIDLNEWVFFQIDYRGEHSWYIVGHKVVNDKWISEDVSLHGVAGFWTLVEFIRNVNASNKYQKCKVSRFNNMHYYDGFYKDLIELLQEVDNPHPKGRRR